MNFGIILPLLFVYEGIQLFRTAWRGRMPKDFVIFGQDESGTPMRREQRLLFYSGGCMLLVLGILSALRSMHYW